MASPAITSPVLPAIAAGAGPFIADIVRPDMAGVSGACCNPENGKPGLFLTPSDSSPVSVAIRAHEYGHLALAAAGIYPNGIVTDLAAKSSELIAQSVLDVGVNSFMLANGVEQVRDLPFPPFVNRRGYDATTYLRSVGVRRKIPPCPILSPEDKKAIKATAREITALLDAPPLLRQEALERIAADFGRTYFEESKQPQSGDGDGDGDGEKSGTGSQSQKPQGDGAPSAPKTPPKRTPQPKPIPESFKSEIEGSRRGFASYAPLMEPAPEAKKGAIIVEAPQGDTGLGWVPMSILKAPITQKAHSRVKLGRRIRPGLSGSLRYPVRALIPAFEGDAFGERRYSQGGTMLIDCSGSMRLDQNDVETIINLHPYMTIAGYAGVIPYHPDFRGDLKQMGYLCVLARNGKRVQDIASIRDTMGRHNMCDGPALQWLARQRGPRIWICDGIVTGKDDDPTDSLTRDAFRIASQAGIRRYHSIARFLAKRPSKLLSSLDGVRAERDRVAYEDAGVGVPA